LPVSTIPRERKELKIGKKKECEVVSVAEWSAEDVPENAEML
jgi:hypothetical protein